MIYNIHQFLPMAAMLFLLTVSCLFRGHKSPRIRSSCESWTCYITSNGSHVDSVDCFLFVQRSQESSYTQFMRVMNLLYNIQWQPCCFCWLFPVCSEVTRVLVYAAQASHELVPPEVGLNFTLIFHIILLFYFTCLFSTFKCSIICIV